MQTHSAARVQIVQAYLADFDWVFWLDSDVWITNPDIRIENILPRRTATLDLAATNDPTGINAGSWMLRNSSWSRAFLEDWWNAEQYVRVRVGEPSSRCLFIRVRLPQAPSCTGSVRASEQPSSQRRPVFLRKLHEVEGAHALAATGDRSLRMQAFGDTNSGDNDAMKALVAGMSPEERTAKVAIAPQCAFNSALWRPSLRQFKRYVWQNRAMRAGFWRPGQLLVHFQGWDKAKVSSLGPAEAAVLQGAPSGTLVTAPHATLVLPVQALEKLIRIVATLEARSKQRRRQLVAPARSLGRHF
jgi:Protein of unknown function, DUF273